MTRLDPDATEHIPTWAASTYTKLAEAYGRPYYEKVADAAAEHATRASGRVLDAGTGPGILPVEIARRTEGIRVDAVDYTEPLVRSGQRRAARHDIANRVSFLVADVHTLPFEANSYAFITCTGVLHGLDDPARALTELYRVLAPGGVVWAFDPAVLPYDESAHELLDDHERAVFAAYQAKGEPVGFSRDEADRIIAATPFEHARYEVGPSEDSRLFLHKTQ